MPNWIAINAHCCAKPSSDTRVRGHAARRVLSHFHKLICTSARPVYELSRRALCRAASCRKRGNSFNHLARRARYLRCSVYTRRKYKAARINFSSREKKHGERKEERDYDTRKLGFELIFYIGKREILWIYVEYMYIRA